MLSERFGSIVPSLSTAKSTVQVNPCRFARILASCGSASSERYSSSPLTSTTCFPLPGPSSPSITIQGSAARAGAVHKATAAEQGRGEGRGRGGTWARFLRCR